MTDQDKQYWTVWEQEHLELLKEAYECIKQTGNPERRITIGCLCSTAGLRECEIKGRLHRFLDINNFLDEVVESKEEWLKRRFERISDKKRLQGEKLEIEDIKREMRLKTNTYKKYEVFMKELIERLNK